MVSTLFQKLTQNNKMKYITGKRRQCECMWRGPSWHSKFTICPTPTSLSLSNTYKTSLLHKHVFSHILSQIQCFIHTFSHSYVPITHTPTKPPTPPFSSHVDQKLLSVHPTLQNWTLKQLIVFKKKNHSKSNKAHHKSQCLRKLPKGLARTF